MPLVALKERVNALIEGPGETGFGWSSTAEDVAEDLDLSEHCILVTGCNSGLGKETMRVLAARGAKVLGAARNQEKADSACESVKGQTEPVVCDLADPETIMGCVEDVRSMVESLDAVICNAGIMALPELEQIHGFEKQFFVNYLGHFMLVHSLIDHLDRSGRVVLLSSSAHRSAPDQGIELDNLSGEKHYDPWEAYGQSKLAMLLFARELDRRFADADHDRSAYGVHPGVIQTNLTRNMGSFVDFMMNIFSLLYLKSIPQGAATQTFAAVHPEATEYSGKYLADCNPRESTEAGRDMELAGKLWDKSETIIADLHENL